jgi:hypothetical protein
MFGGGAASALVAAYLVGSLTLGGAFAQTVAPSPAPAAPAAQESGKQQEGDEAGESAALASQAKITADQAKAAALAKFPGATAGKVELGSENGVLAYSVQLTDGAGKGQDVSVDATSGQVLQAQADGPEAPETPGSQEGPDFAD